MHRSLTPEQRTQLVELIAAELTRSRATAVAAGTEPVEVGRAVAARILALKMQVDRARPRT
jgi:hypothetical protein